MKKDNRIYIVISIIGMVAVIWLALIIAPLTNGGLVTIINELPKKLQNPFNITICENSSKTVLIFLLSYLIGIGAYFSTRKNYKKGKEHGSAKWGDTKEINKKYKQLPESENRILTQDVRMGLNAKKHRRNLNTLFYAKPNLLQASNKSYIILDPKAEILRDTGYMLEKNGFEVRILDLINMDLSFGYNPFAYLKTDNDIQKLVTNLFKSTTPKRKSKQ